MSDEGNIVLSARDAEAFIKMLESDAEPNEALRKAFEKNKDLFQKWVFVVEFRHYTGSLDPRFDIQHEVAYICSSREKGIEFLKANKKDWEAEAKGFTGWWAIWEERVDCDSSDGDVGVRNCEYYDMDGNVIDTIPQQRHLLQDYQ